VDSYVADADAVTRGDGSRPFRGNVGDVGVVDERVVGERPHRRVHGRGTVSQREKRRRVEVVRVLVGEEHRVDAAGSIGTGIIRGGYSRCSPVPKYGSTYSVVVSLRTTNPLQPRYHTERPSGRLPSISSETNRSHHVLSTRRVGLAIT
jgi:hypothetical protein